MKNQEIKLGDLVEDVTSGLRGVAIGRCTYLSGAVYWIIQPPLDQSGSPQRDQYIPDAYCKRAGDGVYVKQKPELGFHARNKKG